MLMFRLAITLIILFAAGCHTPAPYSWQDTRVPARDNAEPDLETCKAFAAKQYKPGIPAGEPYLKEQKGRDNPLSEDTYGEWRPDRAPFQETNINSQPTHDVPVSYTGYPGELDYSPAYLDDILEKCMHDKGWEYLQTPGVNH